MIILLKFGFKSITVVSAKRVINYFPKQSHVKLDTPEIAILNLAFMIVMNKTNFAKDKKLIR